GKVKPERSAVGIRRQERASEKVPAGCRQLEPMPLRANRVLHHVQAVGVSPRPVFPPKLFGLLRALRRAFVTSRNPRRRSEQKCQKEKGAAYCTEHKGVSRERSEGTHY